MNNATTENEFTGKATLPLEATKPTRKAIVIAGPTASGKSALALGLAQAFDGTIINADSMQVYEVLRILTARPTAEDEALAPHRLYGFLSPRESCSAGRWQSLAKLAAEEAWAAGRLPIIVGGTGLYLRSLTEGLSPIPDIPEEIRAAARAELTELGNEAFHARLATQDPEMAARLRPSDSQRIARAWEVLQATGRSLALWQQEPAQGGLAADFFAVVIAPARERLYAGCDSRFQSMIDQGALAEVAALLQLELDPALPAAKALGVAELSAFLRGRITLDEAIRRAQQSTRNYAKRQLTWINGQIIAQKYINTQFSESMSEENFSLIRQFLLT